MDAPTHRQVPGGSGIYLQPGWRFRASREGLASLVMRFRGPTASLISGIFSAQVNGANVNIGRAYRTPNPIYPSLGVYSVDLLSGKGANNLGTLEIEWRGLDPALNQIPPPIYELDRATGNEPLDTHPKWVTDIAGKPSAPKNGAVWVGPDGTKTTDDATGKFDHFSATLTGGAKNPWVGKEDYLVPNSLFKKTYVSHSPPSDLGNVGKISTPDGPAPAPPSGYAWFYLGETSTDQAALYHITGSWRLVPYDDSTKIIYN